MVAIMSDVNTIQSISVPDTIQRVAVSSETGRLRSVIIGTADNWRIVDDEIINETQKHTYHSANPPQRDSLKQQLQSLADTLSGLGVQVLRPQPVAGVNDQLMPRDIGFVVDNTFVITRMLHAARKREWLGIDTIIDRMAAERIIKVPAPHIIEGGDVIVDKGAIYVGVGQRSNEDGVRYIQAQFPHYDVVPVYLKEVAQGEDVLHLDCGFVPVGNHHALIYRDGMKAIPQRLLDTYDLIDITREEQQTLATNVLSVDKHTVISRDTSTRINALLRERSLTVIELAYNQLVMTGGSFRCTSLPLHRE